MATATDARRLVTSARQREQAREVAALAARGEGWAVLDARGVAGAAPAELSRLISAVVDAVAAGGTVTVGAQPDELTTTAAAELLGVSRPTLMKLVAGGEIAAHKVGTHTRLRTADVVAFRRARLERQRRAFEELLAAEDE
ncbi:helix-turn-helix domain-containing protein [Cellulomonas sp. Y8]|uniref:helix-turn-helix domain-containing protein n=1 Tax=Cellulomonas sp. Y8 TaxID=2591145 RepID=UPI003D739685